MMVPTVIVALTSWFFFQAEDGIRDPEMSRGLGPPGGWLFLFAICSLDRLYKDHAHLPAPDDQQDVHFDPSQPAASVILGQSSSLPHHYTLHNVYFQPLRLPPCCLQHRHRSPVLPCLRGCLGRKAW